MILKIKFRDGGVQVAAGVQGCRASPGELTWQDGSRCPEGLWG